MRGLRLRKGGSSPLLQLGLIEEFATDPLVWAVQATVRAFREHVDVEQLSTLACAVGGNTAHHAGPCGVLVERLALFGWSISGQAVVVDQFGPFSVLEGLTFACAFIGLLRLGQCLHHVRRFQGWSL